MKAQAQSQEQTEEHVPDQIDQIQPEQQSEQAEQVEQITDQVENQEPYSENTENTENTTETQAENIPEQSEVPEGYQQPEEVWNVCSFNYFFFFEPFFLTNRKKSLPINLNKQEELICCAFIFPLSFFFG